MWSHQSFYYLLVVGQYSKHNGSGSGMPQRLRPGVGVHADSYERDEYSRDPHQLAGD